MVSLTGRICGGHLPDERKAGDADERVMEPLRELCREEGIEVLETESMKALGMACGIEVGAAAAAVLK
jgi:large subunit ribosomal protein L7A